MPQAFSPLDTSTQSAPTMRTARRVEPSSRGNGDSPRRAAMSLATAVSSRPPMMNRTLPNRNGGSALTPILVTR